MSITVKFFANFRELVGQRQVVMSAEDVGSLLGKLTNDFQKLKGEFYEPGSKKLRSTVNILVNGRRIDLLQGMNTPLKEGDTVAIFPPVSGG
jgi:molybdopterin synthase sulfur carrier subunit